MYKVNLRQLTITNLWPNISSNKILTIRNSLASNWVTIPIEKGNYTIAELTTYLNSQCMAIPNNPPFDIPFGVTFDSTTYHFVFSSSVDIRSDTDCLDLLGINIPITAFLPITESLIPVKLSGPTDLHVTTSLSLYTIPPSGRIAKVPVSVPFGHTLHYVDDSGSQPSLCSEHHIQRIQIHIQGNNNQELDGYEEFTWGVALSLEAIPNPSFVSAQSIERPIEREDNIVIE